MNTKKTTYISASYTEDDAIAVNAYGVTFINNGTTNLEIFPSEDSDGIPLEPGDSISFGGNVNSVVKNTFSFEFADLETEGNSLLVITETMETYD